MNASPIENISLLRFLKATIAGGILFLLPLVLIVVLLGHAMRLASKVAQPISQYLTNHSSVDSTEVKIIAGVLLVVISIAAGLVAGTRPGKTIMRWVENSFLGGLPQYQMMKSMAEGLTHIESTEGISPALVNIEEGWQIGYLLEPLKNGWVAVFLPQVPTPMSGSVMYLPDVRVRPLGITMIQAMAIIQHMGIGSAKVLTTTDLTLP